jgi:hypothetical protein
MCKQTQIGPLYTQYKITKIIHVFLSKTSGPKPDPEPERLFRIRLGQKDLNFSFEDFIQLFVNFGMTEVLVESTRKTRTMTKFPKDYALMKMFRKRGNKITTIMRYETLDIHFLPL